MLFLNFLYVPLNNVLKTINNYKYIWYTIVENDILKGRCVFMKNNIIYVDFSKRCKAKKNANVFFTILNTLKSILKLNKKNAGSKNKGTFDNNRRVL